jgi:hypothetical protein
MLVFDYMIRLYNQKNSVGAAPGAAELATDWRGSAAELATEWGGSAAAGSANSWRGRIDWITVRNYLLLTKAKVAGDVADRRIECWWGQWWRHTLGHDSEYEIVQGLWYSCLAKGVAKPAGIRWVDQKWKGQTLQKLYSSLRSISGRAKAEWEEGRYEDHLSSWRSNKSKLVKIWRDQNTPLHKYKDLKK